MKVVFGDLNFRLYLDVGSFDRGEKIINSEFYEELLKKDDFYFYRKEV